MYQIDGFFKMAEEDNYNEGCDPDTTTNFSVDVKFTGKTVDEVIKKAQNFLNADDDATEKNACDEDGRIDFQLMETVDSNQPSKTEIESWKRGKTRLWLATYTCHVEKVETVRI